VRPSKTEYFAYFDAYVSLVPKEDVLPVLASQADGVRHAGAAALDPKAGHRYAEGKWTVREVIGHLIDTERVFGYRALRIARGDRYSLRGFDENAFAQTACHDRAPLVDLLDEFCTLRHSHVHMFRHLPEEAWASVGIANENPLSVRAIAYILAGHVRHHARVLTERYGVSFPV
jgi:hypothetical protein